MTRTAASSPIHLVVWPLFIFTIVIVALAAAGAPIVSAVEASLLLCVTACPVVAYFGPRRVCEDFPFFVVAVAVGLVLAGCLTTLAQALGLSPEIVLAIYLGGGLLICLARLRRPAPAIRGGDTSDTERPSTALKIVAVVASLAVISVSLVYGFRMGSGGFPAIFYVVDNPYHLSIVRRLIVSDEFPPQSLNYIGQLNPYHYAMLAAPAMVARLSGLAPHTAFFLLGLGTMTAGVAALCWLIARKLSDGWLKIAFMLLLYIGTFHHAALKFAKGIGASLYLLLTGNADAPLPTAMNFSHVLSLAGILFALLLVYLMLCRSETWAKILLVVIVSLSPVVKVLYFICFCVWMGVVALLEFVADRPWKKPFKAFVISAVSGAWPTIAAFVIGVIVMHVEDFAGGHRRLIFAPFRNADVNEDIVSTFKQAAILFLPALICLLVTRGRGLQRRTLLAAGLAFSPLLLISVTALAGDEPGDTDFNWFQVAHPATIGLALLAGLIVADSWPRIARRTRMIVALAFVIAIGSQTLRFPILAIDTALHADHGDEVMDNGEIAPALQAIPVAGSLLVTNDLRNPADNYKRADLQSPMSAIFGHQCFLSTPAYDRDVPDLSEKIAAQALLQSPNWDPSITAAAKRYGWTHFLVHKSAAYPKDIPLERIYDSASYAVYRF